MQINAFLAKSVQGQSKTLLYNRKRRRTKEKSDIQRERQMKRETKRDRETDKERDKETERDTETDKDRAIGRHSLLLCYSVGQDLIL